MVLSSALASPTIDVLIFANAIAFSVSLNWSANKPSALLAAGIKSMPQIGQSPASGCIICGCIEHVHILLVSATVS